MHFLLLINIHIYIYICMSIDILQEPDEKKTKPEKKKAVTEATELREKAKKPAKIKNKKSVSNNFWCL